MKNKNLFLKSYKNLKVLITGTTGFKGSWLAFWLNDLGAKVVGVALKPETGSILFDKLNLKKKISQYDIDICNFNKLNSTIKKEKPDIIFHLAAQSIVSESFKNPLNTFQTNVLGSVNILEACRLNRIPKLVYITSDKCYLNLNKKKNYKETDVLGGLDNYSSSKASAELIFSSYYNSYFNNNNYLSTVSARAGNVIGGGDMKINRIVPDIIRSLSCNKKLILRNPKATRPWQHVLEPISGYLNLAQALCSDKSLNGEGFNFGPRAEQNRTVAELLHDLSAYWHFEDASDAFTVTDNIPFHEAGLLKLNCDKSLALLRWQAALDYRETIKFTSEWYYEYYKNDIDMMAKTISQINAYQNTANAKGLLWT